MTNPHLDHVATRMDERREELGLEWNQVAAAANMDPLSIRHIRNGVTKKPQRKNKAGLERALQWRPGSIDALYRGEAPTPREARTEDAVLETDAAILLLAWRAHDAETLTRRFGEAVHNMPPEYAEALIDRFRELRQEVYRSPEDADEQNHPWRVAQGG